MKYVCDVCGWEYDEELGYPEGGIAPGTKWEDIPADFECPLCSVDKEQFSEAYAKSGAMHRSFSALAVAVRLCYNETT